MFPAGSVTLELTIVCADGTTDSDSDGSGGCDTSGGDRWGVEAGGSLITERNVDVIVLTPNSSVRNNKRSGFASIFLMFVLSWLSIRKSSQRRLFPQDIALRMNATSGTGSDADGAKNTFLEPFYTENDCFTTTGSGHKHGES